MKRVYTMMGVSGSGKSTVGTALAARLSWPFHEGDAYHPQANIAKMSAGNPLTDADRKPWIDAIADAINAAEEDNHVLACSALSAAVRGWLTGALEAEVTFVYLRVDYDLLAQRLKERPAHFFKGSMLDSQLAALEEPVASEEIITVDGSQPLDDLVEELADRLEA